MNIIRENQFFTMVCSRQERWPIVVEENLLPANMVTDDHMIRNDFFRDPLQDDDFFPGPHDFQGTGYHRGHLAAFINHRRNLADANLTMNMMNIVPMLEAFNIGIWRDTERFVQFRGANGNYDNLRVYSGPYKQEQRYLAHHYYSNPVVVFGNHRLIIPKFYFKVVIGVNDAAQTQDIDTFVVPHSASAAVNARNAEFYYADLDDVERYLGRNLTMPNLAVNLVNGV